MVVAAAAAAHLRIQIETADSSSFEDKTTWVVAYAEECAAAHVVDLGAGCLDSRGRSVHCGCWDPVSPLMLLRLHHPHRQIQWVLEQS